MKSKIKILLDECVPKRLKNELKDFDVKTVPEVGWAGKTNGELLLLASGNFDVFITVDKNLIYQQNINLYEICVVVLATKRNRFKDLVPLIPKLLNRIKDIKPGTFIELK